MPVDGWHPVVRDSTVESIVYGTPELIAVVLTYLTHLGSVVFVVPAVAVVYFWAPQKTISWVAAICSYYGIMAGIKSLNSAERPPVTTHVDPSWFPGPLSWFYSHGAGITTTSFPSGNVMVATIVAALFVLDIDVWNKQQRLLVSSLFVGIVGYSRVALGVHYPVDVIGGILLGLVVFGTIVGLRERRGVMAAFLFAVAVTFFSVWVRSNGFGIPTWSGIQGSNRVIAVGSAVGASLAWHYVRDRSPQRIAVSSPRFTFAGAILFVGLSYSLREVIGHPLTTLIWAGSAAAVLIIAPYLLSPGKKYFKR